MPSKIPPIKVYLDSLIDTVRSNVPLLADATDWHIMEKMRDRMDWKQEQDGRFYIEIDVIF